MFLSLLIGLLSGFVLAIPPGPVAAYTIQSTLSKGKRTGIGIGIGVALVDVVFCMLIVFASSALTSRLENFIAAHDQATFACELVLIVIIIIYGLLQFRAKEIPAVSSRIHLEDRIHSNKPILIGSATALSNGFNPTFLPSLAAVLSTITAQLPASAFPVFNNLFFVVGFGVGTFGWLYGLVLFVSRHHEKISPEAMLFIRRASAVVIIGFALFLAYMILFS